MVETKARDPDRVFSTALQCHQAGRIGEATQLCREVLKLDPRHADSLHLLGLIAARDGQHEIAAGHIGKAIAINAHVASYHSSLGNAFQHLSRLEAAIASYGRAIALKPNFPQAHANLGGALLAAGRPGEAIDSLREAIALKPDFAAVYEILANALRGQGLLDEAACCLRGAIALNPDWVEAHNNLGNVLRQQGKLEEAIASHRHTIALRPDCSEVHSNLGNELQDQGRLDEAIACHRRALVLNPDLASGYYNLGNALGEKGQLEQAIACYRRAIELQADYPEAHNNLGNALHARGLPDDAVACYRRALELRPGYVEACNNLGNALREQGRLDEAMACHRQAIALQPDFAAAHGNLASELQEQGLFDDAYQAFERAVELAPRSGTFYHMLANTGRVDAGSPHLRRMEHLACDLVSLPEAERMELHFALGVVHGNSGEHAVSFQHLLEANRLKRSRLAYDEPATLAMFDRIRTVFTAEALREVHQTGDPSDLPVFVVGMPRSGTTLLEQILASHPQIFGAGELPDLPRLLGALETEIAPLSFPEAIADLPLGALAAVGARYVNGVKARDASAARIVDKLPGNFLRIGLIHLAMPRARIIHVRRDPVDTCLSCFAKLFGGQLPYAYDLAEIGRFYKSYEKLMSHWRQVLPAGVMLDVDYENVVADIECQARRMIDFCGLPWNDNCLAFHENHRAVQTHSATQVRQPLYGSSVGRWHVFGDVVRPLLDALGR